MTTARATDHFESPDSRSEAGWVLLPPVGPFLGRDLQALRAWTTGSAGQQHLASQLTEVLGRRGVLLHDLKVPGRRGGIDHVVVAASGIWVIDATADTGKIRGRDLGGAYNIDYRLFVGDRDRTGLIEGLEWQAGAVKSALGDVELPLRGALCLTDATWKRFTKPFTVGNVSITRPDALVGQIAAPGPLGTNDVLQLAVLLTEMLRPVIPGVRTLTSFAGPEASRQELRQGSHRR